MSTGSHDFRQFDVPLERIRLAAIEIGSGPPALFYHGITANAHVFEPLMRRLAGAFRCVSFDQRGHGRSEKPRAGYAARHFADDIAQSVPALGASRALVIGHSLGARNALVAAMKTPHLISAVVAIDFTPFIETAVFDALDARVAGGDQTFASDDDVRRYLHDRYAKLPRDAVDRRARHGYVRDGTVLRPLADPNAMIAASTGLREDLISVMEKIEVPVLMIRGAESKLVSPAAWARARALRPDFKAIELAGADHYVPEEVPDALGDVILGFMQSSIDPRRT